MALSESLDINTYVMKLFLLSFPPDRRTEGRELEALLETCLGCVN